MSHYPVNRLLTSLLAFMQERDLGEDGVEKLLKTRKHKEVFGAWKEIGMPESSPPPTCCMLV
jgi:hypothetical protein